MKDKQLQKLEKQAKNLLKKYPKKAETGSEFGKGLVYCLALWTSHLNNEFATNLGKIHFLAKQTKKDRDIIISPNPPPNKNYGKDMEYAIFWWQKLRPIYLTTEEAFSSQIELWANGASDHLYEMYVPKRLKGTELDKKVEELKHMGLSMGHGFAKDKVWTYDDFVHLNKLTGEIAKLIDKELGVDVIKAQWGEF